MNLQGFNESDIFNLYSYLVAYEKSGIGKTRVSTKKLIKAHPEIASIVDVLNLVTYHKSTNDEMKVIDPHQLNNEMYLTKSRANLRLSFLAHLRNGIAHGCVVGHDRKVFVNDFLVNRPIELSARGCIDMKIIKQITNIISKINL